ncbi:MAG: transcription repressor NadR [Lachnospiraceae bacterium]|nr:transcription repressor NadR [Lachnospiraceae bacterium]
MEGNERREKLLELLTASKEPISGSDLAKKLGVSRQVIVQDIALLRAVNKNILSTTKGYILYVQEKERAHRCFSVRHTTSQIEDELCTIVDYGGKVLNVIVSHPIYGSITTDLIIETRKDVYDFVAKVTAEKTVPLKELTNDYHVHTVEADNEQILDTIEEELRKKHYLVD